MTITRLIHGTHVETFPNNEHILICDHTPIASINKDGWLCVSYMETFVSTMAVITFVKLYAPNVKIKALCWYYEEGYIRNIHTGKVKKVGE